MFVWKIYLTFLQISVALAIRNPHEIEYVEKKIFTPSLDELKTVLEDALKRNFDFASVEIVDNPDLTKDPFYLASPGIGGDPIIIEYGSDEYFVPFVDKTKVYELIPMIREIASYKQKEFFACGAGSGPIDWLQHSCEGVYNLKVYQNGSVDNESHIVQITDDGVEVLKVPNGVTEASILGNIFLTEGKMGKVLKVVAANRTGDQNFISAMRNGLAETYSEDQIVGLGGVFVLKSGNAFIHVMGDFPKTPIITQEDYDNWLTFHEMPAPLIALGNFVSMETDFKLRLQHFHCFSKFNYGGHYYSDTTPEIAEYEGYFNVAERVFIIDKNVAVRRSLSAVLISLSVLIIKFI